MAKDEQQEAFEKILSANLARAIDFIKFAETKNAALLTFNSAWLLALFNVVNSSPPTNGAITYMVICMCFLALSGISSIISFLPKTSIGYFSGTHHRSGNLLFVGDIDGVLVPDLEAGLRSKYKPAPDNSVTDQYISDLVQQISINSKIAMRKFRSFNRGASLTLIGLSILALPYIIRASIFLSSKIGE